jgi:hypothetical protein
MENKNYIVKCPNVIKCYRGILLCENILLNLMLDIEILALPNFI